jgi:Tfp pilus assembly protein PilO
MSATEGQERRNTKKNRLAERLHNPTQLRLFLTAAVLAVAYGAVYVPLHNRIAATTRSLLDAQKRLSLAAEVEQLRKQFQQVEERLPKQADSNELVQYVLDGVRQFPLKLDSYAPGAPGTIGPYKVVTLKIRLSGAFADIDRFLEWLESNRRLFRIDDIKIKGQPESGDDLALEIMVLGLIG